MILVSYTVNSNTLEGSWIIIVNSSIGTMASLTLSAIGIVPVAVAASRAIARFQSVRRVLRFSWRERVDIVVTTSMIRRSVHDRAAALRYLTAEGELIGIASVTTTLGQHYRQKKIHVHVSDHVRNQLDEDLIILGGPVANQLSSHYLEEVSQAMGISIIFDAPNCRVSIGSFEVNDYDIQLVKNIPQRDLGLVVVSANPFAQSNQSVLCAGLTTYGTGAATQYVFRNVLGRHGKEERSVRRYLRQRPMIALFEFRLNGGRLLSARLLHRV